MFRKGYLHFDVYPFKAPCLSSDMGFFMINKGGE
jgi:hypothetical protein